MTEQDARTLRRGVDGHYGRNEAVAERMLARLRERGIDPANTPFDDVPAHDELHLRGRAATIELSDLATLTGSMRVLDVGAGIGGSSRFLAARFDCRVVGVDLTAEFCRSARLLSDAFGLDHRTDFLRADATRLPFPDETFPMVWTQHAQMNVADKASFYGEAVRVLEPAGQLLFHDIFATGEGELEFPVLWAPKAELSHLVRAERVADFLLERGLRRVEWRDRTLPTIGWLRDLMTETEASPTTSASRTAKLGNVLAGLENGRLQVIQARWDRRPR